MEITSKQLVINLRNSSIGIKDPTPVWDGNLFHLYGTKTKSNGYAILHLTAKTPEGPWQEEDITLQEVPLRKGGWLCAPGVLYDHATQTFEMFIQTHFNAVGGVLWHFQSQDGKYFKAINIAYNSTPGTFEAGVYDVQPAIVNKKRYLSYSAFPEPKHGDIYLLESETNTWDGPWKKAGRILAHEEVEFHNQHTQEDYEWGLEGSHLLQLPNKTILMAGVCFLPHGEHSNRQRLFLAHTEVLGKSFTPMKPLITPSQEGWDNGENGHGGLLLADDTLYIFHQAKQKGKGETGWRYGLIEMSLEQIQAYTQNAPVAVYA